MNPSQPSSTATSARPCLTTAATARPAATETLFTLDKVSLEYQQRSVLNNISLTIADGERVALIGKSGVGKSTLLKHLRQLRRHDCAWCPQQPGLVPSLSTYHNIYMGALERHNSFYNLFNLIKPLRRSMAEVSRLAGQLQLREQLFDRVESLSGGQQQRIAIGRALYQQKRIFLGDEPVSSLDTYQAQRLLEHITQQHSSAILALHDTDQALKLCSRLIGLKDGAIFFDLPAQAVSAEHLAELYR